MSLTWIAKRIFVTVGVSVAVLVAAIGKAIVAVHFKTLVFPRIRQQPSPTEIKTEWLLPSYSAEWKKGTDTYFLHAAIGSTPEVYRLVSEWEASAFARFNFSLRIERWTGAPCEAFWSVVFLRGAGLGKIKHHSALLPNFKKEQPPNGSPCMQCVDSEEDVRPLV